MVLFFLVLAVFAVMALAFIQPSNDVIITTIISLGLAFLGALVYVSYHFITKYW